MPSRTNFSVLKRSPKECRATSRARARSAKSKLGALQQASGSFPSYTIPTQKTYLTASRTRWAIRLRVSRERLSKRSQKRRTTNPANLNGALSQSTFAPYSFRLTPVYYSKSLSSENKLILDFLKYKSSGQGSTLQLLLSSRGSAKLWLLE